MPNQHSNLAPANERWAQAESLLDPEQTERPSPPANWIATFSVQAERLVERGARLLDEYHGNPDWAHKIDSSTFDMGDEEKCVLGQLFGDFDVQSAELTHFDTWIRGEYRRRVTRSPEGESPYEVYEWIGTYLHHDGNPTLSPTENMWRSLDGYRILTLLWRGQIADRVS